MYYLILFLIAYILFILLIFQKYQQNNFIFKVINLIFIVFLILLIGFRYNVGTDYSTYEIWFHMWYEDITIEWIYTGLNYLIKVNGGEFYHLTLLLAIISQTLLIIGLKRWGLSSKEISIALIIYTTSFVFIFANGVRQGLAVLVFLIAARYIFDRNFLKFFALIMLGIGFHKSIILVLPFYFLLYKIKLNFVFTILSIIIAYILVWNGQALKILELFLSFSFYDDKYMNDTLIYTTSSSIFSLGVLLKTVLLIVLMFFVKNKNLEYKLVINFYIIGTIIRILSLSTHLYNRVGWYFQIFELLAAIVILREVSNKKIKMLLLSLIIIINVGLMFKSVILDGEINDFLYKSVFQK